jgi:hypothetical protein
VKKFNAGESFIWIEFVDRKIYLYSAENGVNEIERMKQLAIKGESLTTFINQHTEIKNNYLIRYK